MKVTIIGITHIDTDSQEKVSRILKQVKPDAVCLELDEHRLKALLENENTALTSKPDEVVKEKNDFNN